MMSQAPVAGMQADCCPAGAVKKGLQYPALSPQDLGQGIVSQLMVHPGG